MYKSFLLSFLFLSLTANADQVVLTKDNTVHLNDEFTAQSIANLTKQAKDLDSRIPSNDPIYLVLNSPGGSIEAGLEAIENLSNLRRPVKTITLFSASMGFHTVEGLGERLIISTGTLMSHRAKGEFWGEFPGQLDTRYGYYLKRVTKMEQQAVKRTNGKYTLKSYHDLIENEFWCEGQDCVDSGFADKVITASCDKSLSGTYYSTVFQDILFGHSIEVKAEYDNCPLNTNPLKYNIFIDGEPLFKDAVETAQPKVVTGQQAIDPWASLNSYYNSYSDKPQPTLSRLSLSKEELFDIIKTVKDKLSKLDRKEIIKGY